MTAMEKLGCLLWVACGQLTIAKADGEDTEILHSKSDQIPTITP